MLSVRRLVGLLLIPLLIVDPALGAPFLTPQPPLARASATLFTENALSAKGVSFLRSAYDRALFSQRQLGPLRLLTVVPMPSANSRRWEDTHRNLHKVLIPWGRFAKSGTEWTYTIQGEQGADVVKGRLLASNFLDALQAMEYTGNELGHELEKNKIDEIRFIVDVALDAPEETLIAKNGSAAIIHLHPLLLMPGYEDILLISIVRGIVNAMTRLGPGDNELRTIPAHMKYWILAVGEAGVVAGLETLGIGSKPLQDLFAWAISASNPFLEGLDKSLSSLGYHTVNNPEADQRLRRAVAVNAVLGSTDGQTRIQQMLNEVDRLYPGFRVSKRLRDKGRPRLLIPVWLPSKTEDVALSFRVVYEKGHWVTRLDGATPIARQRESQLAMALHHANNSVAFPEGRMEEWLRAHKIDEIVFIVVPKMNRPEVTKVHERPNGTRFLRVHWHADMLKPNYWFALFMSAIQVLHTLMVTEEGPKGISTKDIERKALPRAARDWITALGYTKTISSLKILGAGAAPLIELLESVHVPALVLALGGGGVYSDENAESRFLLGIAYESVLLSTPGQRQIGTLMDTLGKMHSGFFGFDHPGSSPPAPIRGSSHRRLMVAQVPTGASLMVDGRSSIAGLPDIRFVREKSGWVVTLNGLKVPFDHDEPVLNTIREAMTAMNYSLETLGLQLEDQSKYELRFIFDDQLNAPEETLRSEVRKDRTKKIAIEEGHLHSFLSDSGYKEMLRGTLLKIGVNVTDPKGGISEHATIPVHFAYWVRVAGIEGVTEALILFCSSEIDIPLINLFRAAVSALDQFPQAPADSYQELRFRPQTENDFLAYRILRVLRSNMGQDMITTMLKIIEQRYPKFLTIQKGPNKGRAHRYLPIPMSERSARSAMPIWMPPTAETAENSDSILIYGRSDEAKIRVRAASQPLEDILQEVLRTMRLSLPDLMHKLQAKGITSVEFSTSNKLTAPVDIIVGAAKAQIRLHPDLPAYPLRTEPRITLREAMYWGLLSVTINGIDDKGLLYETLPSFLAYMTESMGDEAVMKMLSNMGTGATPLRNLYVAIVARVNRMMVIQDWRPASHRILGTQADWIGRWLSLKQGQRRMQHMKSELEELRLNRLKSAVKLIRRFPTYRPSKHRRIRPDKNELINLLKAHWGNLTSISRALFVSPLTVSAWVKKYGLQSLAAELRAQNPNKKRITSNRIAQSA